MTSTTQTLPDEARAASGSGRFLTEAQETTRDALLEISERGHEVLNILNQLFERAEPPQLSPMVR